MTNDNQKKNGELLEVRVEFGSEQCALLALSVIGLVSSSARVTSVKSAKGVTQFVTETRTHRSDPRYTWVR